jgi:hypothetical protein
MKATVLIFCGLVSGCVSPGPGGSLTVEEVQRIGAGDASGRALTGSYTLDIDGSDVWCREGILWGAGDQKRTGVAIQEDGVLSLTLDKPFLQVADFSGAINSDGTFAIGGADTRSYNYAVRMRGRFVEGESSAALEFHAYYGKDDPLDCGGSALVTIKR